MAINKQTWLGYMESMTAKEYNTEELNIEGIEEMLSVKQHFHSIFYHSIPAIYLVDYTTGKYMIMSKSSRNIIGYEAKEFMDNGVGFTLDIYQPDDLKIFNEKIFSDRLRMLKNIPYKEHSDYIFSYNYRMRNNKGSYINYMQRNCFIKSDENGLPLLSLGMVINLEHYKKENPIIQVVEKLNSGSDSNSTEILFKKMYYLREEDQIFTKREKEILLWLTDGLTGKEIANKLFISDSTVINHCKNMRSKSNSKNIAELVGFAFKNNII